jgi:hypothetical protein
MKLLFYSFLISMAAVACNNGKAEKNQTPSEIIPASMKDTGKLTNFPGTYVYITLPEGFIWNETAMGFLKEEDGSVIKCDKFKKMRYEANMPIEETMGSLVNQQPITINGYKGEIKTYEQGSTSIKLDLSFGDNSFMEFIEATYFSHREQTGKDILAALKTIQVKNNNGI